MADKQEVIANAEFGKMSEGETPELSREEHQHNLEMIYDIPITVTAEIGSSVVTIKDLLNFSPGSVIELDRQAGESIDLLVNGVLIGKGDVVIVNENFGVRITEIVCVEERLKKLSD